MKSPACLSALFVLLLLFEPAQAQPTPKEAFEVEKIPDGRLIAAKPELAGRTKAWVWYAPGNLLSGEAEKWMVEQFLAAGISTAGCNGGYGGPNAIKRLNAFYTEMTEKRGYAKKPIRQTLSLLDASVLIEPGDVQLRVWVDANQPVIRVQGKSQTPRTAAVTLKSLRPLVAATAPLPNKGTVGVLFDDKENRP